VRLAQHRSNFGKIPAAVAEPNVAERNSVVSAKNAAIGQSSGGKRGPAAKAVADLFRNSLRSMRASFWFILFLLKGSHLKGP